VTSVGPWRSNLAAVKLVLAGSVLGAILIAASPAGAAEPDGGIAFVAGAAAYVATFTVGGLLLATSNDGATQSNAGWLTIESGFVMAPLASHAFAGEWGRGLVFAAPPLAAMAGTATLFDLQPQTIIHGSLPQQRVLWSLFVVGLLSGSAGIVDGVLAPSRRRPRPIAIAPSLGRGQMGVSIEGTL
jgi:hypothetical protein